MKTLAQLRAELQKALGAIDALEKTLVDDAGNARDMTAEEVEKYDKLLADAESKRKAVDMRERADRARGIQVAADPATVPATVKDDKRFKSFGEFMHAVYRDAVDGGRERDPRLIFQKASGLNESVPSEGGFLVQTDHSTAMLDLMHEMGDVLSRVRRLTLSTNANSIELPRVDEVSRARGSRFGGVRAHWLNEAATLTPSQPKFDVMSLKVNKLGAVGYITEELLADAPLAESIYMQAFAEELTYEVEDAIVNGNGANKPLGFLNSGALISVAKDASQPAATISARNVINMYDRLPLRSRRNAVWLVADAQVETQLLTMTMPNSNVNIYRMPGQNVATPSGEIYGFLLGRPVIPVEYMAALGTIGDIALVDLSQYVMIDKGNTAAAQSMHVRFLQEEMAFRITYRLDGQPAWKSPVTTANGASSKSPFIGLETRA